MNFKFRHIKHRLVVQIFLSCMHAILIVCIILFANRQISKTISIENQFLDLKKEINDAYSLKNNLMLAMSSDESLRADDFDGSYAKLNSMLSYIQDSALQFTGGKYVLHVLKKNGLLDSLSTAITDYKFSLHSLMQFVKDRGNTSSGRIKEIRTVSDRIYGLVSSNAVLQTKYSQLKMIESDFLLRSGLDAYNELLLVIQEFEILGNESITDILLLEKFKADLVIYLSEIQYLHNLYLRIGSTERGNGLLFETEFCVNRIDILMNNILQIVTDKINTSKKIIILCSGVFMAIILAIYILILLKFLNHIRKPLSEAIENVHLLSKGKTDIPKLPEDISYEFSVLNIALNKVIQSIDEKKQFIDDLLKQRFDTDLSLQGRNDTFGMTLLSLKETMKRAREEQLKHDEENRLRRYLNEGLAIFGELLRANTNNLEKLADTFIRELVKYLDSLQGGLFLVSEKDENQLYLASSFAYNRKKYIRKSLEKGEGLVGTCALEKKSINLKEIPENYLEITSGLGDAPPTNLLLIPVIHEYTLIGVIELASLKKYEKHQIEAVETIAASLASTLISAKNNMQTSELLKKSQQQAAEMSEQEEEMRQNMEELKATQEESMRREQELEGILHALNQSFYVIEYDNEGIIIKANQKLSYLLNISIDDIIGKTHKQIFGKGSKADFSLFTKVSDGDTIELIENVEVNNKPIEIKNTFSPIRTKTGETITILNIMSVKY